MDPTRSEQPALTRAIMLGREFDASVELFLVDYHTGLMRNWFYDEAHLEKLKDSFLASKKLWLDSYIAQVVDAGLVVSTDVRWHKPIYEAIIEKANDCQADMVIKSTHRHPTINKLFFSPNDWQLLKACPVPLLLVKDNCKSSYTQIMAAVDPSQAHNKVASLDKIIMEVTEQLASEFYATAHVAHCYEPVSALQWEGANFNAHGVIAPLPEHYDYLEKLNQHNQDAFNELIKGHHFLKENQHLEAGAVNSKLLSIVESNEIDLLVMGTTYRSGFTWQYGRKNIR